MTYKTLEELQKELPMRGRYIYAINEASYSMAYYNKMDLEIYRKRYTKVEIIDDTTCICYEPYYSFVDIDGYIFDGISWYPAEETWDGWVPLGEEQIDLCKRAIKIEPF